MKWNVERYYPLIVFLFSFLLYANTLSHDYNLDDELVTINHRTTSQGLSGIPEILSSYYYEDEMGYKYDYRPVTHITFAIEHEFFGDNPSVSHIVNVLLYALLCLLIFYVSNRLLPEKSPLFGFIVALIFAVHPLHTEVVASIKNRDEILSLLFGLLSLHFTFGLKVKEHLKNIFTTFLVLLFFILGFYSKNSIVSFVFILPIFIVFFTKEISLFFSLFTFIFLYFFVFLQVGISLETGLLGFFSFLFLFILSNQVVRDSFRNKWLIISEKTNSLILNSQLQLYFSLFVYVVINIISVVLKNENFITIAFLIFVVINANLIQSKQVKFLWVLFISIALRLFVFEDLAMSHIGIALMYTLFYFSTKFFRPFAFVLFFVQLIGTQFDLASIIQSITFFFIFLHYSFSGHIFIKKVVLPTKFIFLLFFIVSISNLYIYNSKENPNAIVAKEIPEAIIKSEIDRPILFVENPLIENWNIQNRASFALSSYSFYIKKLILPYPLAFYYGYDEISILENQYVIFSVTGIFLFSIAFLVVFLFVKKEYILLFSVLLIILSLFSYSNFLVPVAGIVGERLAFTASFGYALFLALIIFRLFSFQRFKVFFSIFLVLGFIFFSSYTIYRNALWENKIKLFSTDINNLDNSAQAHALLAYAYMQKGSEENNIIEYANKSKPHFEKAIAIYPSFFNWYFDLGRLNVELKNFDEAQFNFETAIKMDSTYTESYYYLSSIAVQQNNYASVIKYANKILTFDPNNIQILFDLSAAYYFSGLYNQVLSVNDQIINLDSSIPEAYLNKAYAYAQMRDFNSSVINIENAKKINPNHPDINNVQDLMKELKNK